VCAATPGLGADLQTFKSPEWAGRQEWGNRQRDRALKGMKYFDTVLRDHSFVAGDAFSMADITVFAGLMFADAAGIVVPEDHSALNAWRAINEQHQFLTVEFSCPFLAKHLAGMEGVLHPIAKAAIEDCPCEQVTSATVRLGAAQQQLIATLRQPPVYASAQPLWYQCKALELAVTFLLQPPPEKEMFCTRQQRVGQERVQQVIFLLKQNLAEPPSLEELGKKIGCSHFYLSRIFSAQTGHTITQHLRQLRMERAAELLKSGEHNVTEAALEVGYSSLSHFSAAFHETFGCCPGLYPLATESQPLAARRK